MSMKIVAKISRLKGHRVSLVKNQFISLIQHGCIRTTLSKARVLRQFSEPWITKMKEDTLQYRRLIKGLTFNRNNALVIFAFEKIGPALAKREGGYLRIRKFISKRTDAAPMAIVEFVDFHKIDFESFNKQLENLRKQRENFQSEDNLYTKQQNN